MLADRVFADVWEAMIHDDGVVPVAAREWAVELSERAVDVTSGLGNMLPARGNKDGRRPWSGACTLGRRGVSTSTSDQRIR